MTDDANQTGAASIARHRTAAEVAFNPDYGSANSEYRAALGGQAISWNPGDGAVKGATERDVARVGAVAQTQGQAVTFTHASADGLVNYQVQLEQMAGARAEHGGASARAAAAEVGSTVGTRGRYLVSLPAGHDATDAARVNPFDPTSIPVGGRVTMDAQAFQGTALEASFRHIATQTQLTEASGASYRVDRVDDAHVRVSMGPNQAVSAFNGMGVAAGGVSAMVGRQDALGQSTLRTATFDLAQPDGQAAYAHFVGSGEIAAQTPGVDGVASVERLGMSSQTRLQVGIGDALSADLGGARNAGEVVRTRFEDGSHVDARRLAYSDNVPMTRLSVHGADGTENVPARRYEFQFDLRDQPHGEQIAGMLNTALTGDPRREGPVQAGDNLTLRFDEAQMRTLMTQTQALAQANPTGDPRWRLLAEDGQGKPQQDVDAFATSLARLQGQSAYGMAERLFHLSNAADGDLRKGFAPIEASVDSPRLRNLPAPSPLLPQDPRHPDSPDHGLMRQGQCAVEALDAGMGRQPDAMSERLYMGLVVAARREGLERIDQAVLSENGQYAFAVQGDPHGADRRLARAETSEAVATPVGEHVRALQATPEAQVAEPPEQQRGEVQAAALAR
ncbi:XVIPCD domain-containing protein [Stenotrophomonas sp.]|uniref:XVIPCD domain-containing protein n=1 Tax=Stenotrophomonas sp. TaxID=69392 RepID=UPI002FC9567C